MSLRDDGAVLTARIPKSLFRRLAALAKRLSLSRSEVVRRAIDEYDRSEESRGQEHDP